MVIDVRLIFFSSEGITQMLFRHQIVYVGYFALFSLLSFLVKHFTLLYYTTYTKKAQCLLGFFDRLKPLMRFFIIKYFDWLSYLELLAKLNKFCFLVSFSRIWNCASHLY